MNSKEMYTCRLVELEFQSWLVGRPILELRFLCVLFCIYYK